MPGRILLAVLIVTGALAAPAPDAAAQSTQTFVAPKVKGVRLDWCRNWAQNCGAPAAQLFCREMGFGKAQSWRIDENVGERGISTLVFGDGRLCQESYCSGFRMIVCAGEAAQRTAQPDTKSSDQPASVKPISPERPDSAPMAIVRLTPNSARYDRPQINRVLLDWCLHWGRDCGRPAADLFCRKQKFDNAESFRVDPSAGARGLDTIVFGDGRVCNDRRCRAFQSITCVRDAPLVQTAEPPTPQPPEKVASAGVPKEPDKTASPPALQTAMLPPKTELQRTAEIARRSWTFTKLASFKPLPVAVVRTNWVKSIRALDTYPSGAALYRCGSGDCSVSFAADLEVDPASASKEIFLNFNVLKVPHAEGAWWQVSYLPFPPFANASVSDRNPPGLVASGRHDYRQGGFLFDAGEAAGKLPGGAKDAIFHVRVLPVAGSGTGDIVGQPSNVMRVFYGARLPPQEPYKIYTKSEVPGSAPVLRLMGVDFQPFKSVDRWPPGCQTWEEKYGEDESIWEELGDFLIGVWDWASSTYQWARSQVIELARALTFNLIPKEIFAVALDVALTSMGIPPNVPNLDQLMREGAEGLAKELAKSAVSQIPAADLAANVGNLAADVTLAAAANMAEEELRGRLEREIETRSRDAILAVAAEMEKQLAQSGKGKLCTGENFHPMFKVTVANAGDRDYEDVRIEAAAGPVYRGGSWTVSLRRGERTTLVGTGQPILTNGPYSYPLLTAKQRLDEDMQRWWTEILPRKLAPISIDASGPLSCLGGDPSSQFCEPTMVNLHRSPPQMVTQPYRYGQ
jgi:hypothetical protein